MAKHASNELNEQHYPQPMPEIRLGDDAAGEHGAISTRAGGVRLESRGHDAAGGDFHASADRMRRPAGGDDSGDP